MASRTNSERAAGTSADGAWVRQRAAPEAESNRLGRLLAEARWIVGGLATVALFAMLATYSREDPSFTHAAAAAGVNNLGGRVGAWIADVLLLLFGGAAWLLVLGLGVWVARGFRHLYRTSSGADPLADDLPGWAHGLGFVLLLAGAIGLEALRLYALKVALPGAPGGLVGVAIAQFVQAGVGFFVAGGGGASRRIH
jgi:S-DNA-T family DNA segregation ATPase FtsK/SpoIIIE